MTTATDAAQQLCRTEFDKQYTKDMLRELSDADFYGRFCVKPADGIAEFWRSGGATGAPLFYPRSFEDIDCAMTGFARISKSVPCGV